MGEMTEASDAQLLRDYVEHGHEAAFHEIVVRHTDAVYSAALRQVISPALARDVAQSVFTDLARKAPSLARTLDAKGSLWNTSIRPPAARARGCRRSACSPGLDHRAEA